MRIFLYALRRALFIEIDNTQVEHSKHINKKEPTSEKNKCARCFCSGNPNRYLCIYFIIQTQICITLFEFGSYERECGAQRKKTKETWLCVCEM